MMASYNRQYQQGLTTLILSSIILFAITMIVLYTSKSALIEQKIFANSLAWSEAELDVEQTFQIMSNNLYRNKPSELDFLEKNKLSVVNIITPELKENSLGETLQELKQELTQLNLQGLSQDKSSQSILNLSISHTPIIGNRKALVPVALIVKDSILAEDHLIVSNGEKPQTIWSGGDVKLGQSLTSQTFIPSGDEINSESKITLSKIPITKGISVDTPLSVSSGLGKGHYSDVISHDVALNQLSGEQFFKNFMNESKWFIKHLAIDNQQLYNPKLLEEIIIKQKDNNDLPLSGLIWLENDGEDISLSNLTLGSINSPVIFVVDVSNAALFTRGNIQINGLLYVIGNWESAGEITVNGAVIVEGKILSNLAPEFVKTQIHYESSLLNINPSFVGSKAVVSGSIWMR